MAQKKLVVYIVFQVKKTENKLKKLLQDLQRGITPLF